MLALNGADMLFAFVWDAAELCCMWLTGVEIQSLFIDTQSC